MCFNLRYHSWQVTISNWFATFMVSEGKQSIYYCLWIVRKGRYEKLWLLNNDNNHSANEMVWILENQSSCMSISSLAISNYYIYEKIKSIIKHSTYLNMYAKLTVCEICLEKQINEQFWLIIRQINIYWEPPQKAQATSVYQ